MAAGLQPAPFHKAVTGWLRLCLVYGVPDLHLRTPTPTHQYQERRQGVEHLGISMHLGRNMRPAEPTCDLLQAHETDCIGCAWRTSACIALHMCNAERTWELAEF